MPHIYRTAPDVSLDDILALIEAKGERLIQVLPRQGRDSFIVFTEDPVDDTGRPWVPSVKETR